MNYRVVPGDIAVINRGPRIGLLGRVVDVLYRVRPAIVDGALVYCIDGCDFTALPSDGVVWRVRTQGGPFTLINRSGKAVEGSDWPCRDEWLAPLRDVEGIDQVLLKVGGPTWPKGARRG